MTDHARNPDDTRRRLLQGGGAAAALGALPGIGPLSAYAQGAFDWKRFKGQKIEVFLTKSPRGDLLTKYHKEFEDLTGIEVGSEMIPEQQQRQKAVIEFNSGNPSFDVIGLSYHVQKRQFAKNNWLTDVRPYLNDKSMAAPDLDFADFAKGGLNYAVEPDGRVMSLPLNLDPWVVYYNKELFAAKNIGYPKNFAEMLAAAAAKLNDPGKGVSGFVGRGLKNANVPVWTSFLLGYGGSFMDAKGKLLTDTPEAIEAGKMYQTLMAKSGPAGVAGFNWNESQALFLQGKAAMWLDGIGFAQPLEDPAKSTHRRQGRLRRDARRSEGPGVGTVRRWRRDRIGEQEEGTRVVLSAMGVEQGEPDAHAAGRSGRAGAQLRLRGCAAVRRFQGAEGVGRLHVEVGGNRAAGLAHHRAGDGIPRRVRHCVDQHDQRRRSGDRAQEGDRGIPAGARQEREGLGVFSGRGRERCGTSFHSHSSRLRWSPIWRVLHRPWPAACS